MIVIGNPDLYAGLFAQDAPLHFAEPLEEAALIGAGTTHHVAWRPPTTPSSRRGSSGLTELGLRPTPVQDRKYFQSVYFRMPDGVLIEIATDGPGFLVDEPPESLGQRPLAAAVARARARDARARAHPDRLSRGYNARSTRWWRNW